MCRLLKCFIFFCTAVAYKMTAKPLKSRVGVPRDTVRGPGGSQTDVTKGWDRRKVSFIHEAYLHLEALSYTSFLLLRCVREHRSKLCWIPDCKLEVQHECRLPFCQQTF